MIKSIQEISDKPIYDDDWFFDQYENCHVDLNIKPLKPQGLISIGFSQYGSQTYPNYIFTRGEMSCISAPSKSFKSTFKAHLISSFIAGESDSFPEIRGHREKDNLVLDIDTEQGLFYAWHTFNRVKKLTGTNLDKHYKGFKLKSLDVDERVAYIEKLIEHHDPTLVFIDGVADLINDTNDLVSSNYITQKLLRWTDIYNIHICVVIHNAYGTLKPTGHLGSAIIKKVETCLSIQPDENDSSLFKCVHQYSRGARFEDFYFKYDKVSGLLKEVYENNIETG